MSVLKNIKEEFTVVYPSIAAIVFFVLLFTTSSAFAVGQNRITIKEAEGGQGTKVCAFNSDDSGMLSYYSYAYTIFSGGAGAPGAAYGAGGATGGGGTAVVTCADESWWTKYDDCRIRITAAPNGKTLNGCVAPYGSYKDKYSNGSTIIVKDGVIQ